MSKILSIANAALTFIVLVVLIILLVQVGSLKSTLTSPTEDMAEQEKEVVPISQLEEFNMEENFIFSFEDPENTKKKTSVVFKVGFAIDSKNKGAKDAKSILTDQGQIVKDRISGLLATKSLEDFSDVNQRELVKDELLELVNGLIGNDSVYEVYFINLLIN